MTATTRPRAAADGATTPRSAEHPLLRKTAGGLFGALARVRGDRALHPQGVAFDAVLSLRDGPGLALLAPPLSSARPLPAAVRLSRGLGLPRRLPDFLGVAVRLPDLFGPSRPLDLLTTSSLGGIGGVQPLSVARSFGWRWYASVMPYRIGGRLLFLGALASHPGEEAGDVARLDTTAPDALAAARAAAISGTLRFSLAVATPLRPLVPFGELRVGPPLTPERAAALRFDPANVGGEIRLAGGPLDATRDAAYRASRQATRRAR